MKGNKTLLLVTKDMYVMIETGCLYGRKQIVDFNLLPRELCTSINGLTQLFK